MSDSTQRVVPAGRMAGSAQPVLGLPCGPPGGLELRPWQLSDADALMTAGQDEAIRRWNLFSVASPGEARTRIERMHARWRAESGAIWAIARPGGEAIGLIGWNDIDLVRGSAEIVYWLLPAARGGGLAVEAVRAVSHWALNVLGLHRLRLCHSVENPASCRVAAKAGYAFEGTMRSALLHADGWHDQHLHSLVQGVGTTSAGAWSPPARAAGMAGRPDGPLTGQVTEAVSPAALRR